MHHLNLSLYYCYKFIDEGRNRVLAKFSNSNDFGQLKSQNTPYCVANVIGCETLSGSVVVC